MEAKANIEINNLISNQNIINFIRSLRIGWISNIIRMDGQRLTKKLYKWTPIKIKTVGRPKMRWEGD